MLEVDVSTQGLWKASALTGCNPKQTCCDDFSCGECPELAGKYYLPDEQDGKSFVLFGCGVVALMRVSEL